MCALYCHLPAGSNFDLMDIFSRINEMKLITQMDVIRKITFSRGQMYTEYPSRVDVAEGKCLTIRLRKMYCNVNLWNEDNMQRHSMMLHRNATSTFSFHQALSCRLFIMAAAQCSQRKVGQMLPSHFTWIFNIAKYIVDVSRKEKLAFTRRWQSLWNVLTIPHEIRLFAGVFH